MKKTSAALLALLTPLATHAADAVNLGTQTVTADFRNTDVQQLPEAVTVVDREQIEARSAEHLEQILSFAPNVNFSSGSSRGRYYQIRGIGERSQFIDPVNPSVGLLIDGIDMTGLGAAATLFDVQQVEILRGPQGTRFGANALAGMINITTAAPTTETEGYVRGKLGNYNSYGLGGALSGSLSHNLQGRIAVQGFQSDGYMDNAFLNRDDTQNIDEQLVRAKLAWQPDALTDIGLTYLYANINNGYDAFTVDNSRTSLADEPGKDTQETHALALNLQRRLNNAVTLETTVTGSRNDALYSYDDDWVNPGYGELWGAGFDEYQREFRRHSLDVRLLSGTDGRLFNNSTDWAVGAYLLQREEDLQRNYSWDPAPYLSDLNTDSVSVYAELQTQFSATTRVIYGIRAEQWQNDFTDNANALNPADNNIAENTDETLYGGKLVLEHQLHTDHLLYGSVARGYKAGGINTDPDISAARRTFDAEYNNTAELGLKSSLQDDRLQTRLALFYIQRKDQQVKSSYPIPNSSNFMDYLANAAEGRNYGLELESNWQLSNRLHWELSYGYLNTEFVDYRYTNEDGDLVDKTGRSQAHAPEHSLATAITWNFTSALALRVETEAKSGFYFSDSHDEKSSGYALWHARLSYQRAAYEIALSGRNLADRDVATRGFGGFNNDSKNPASSRYVQLGEPRLIMLEGKYSF
ncbi:TonB-dependent receptor [Venatoribacter cucullus]|uniref:TonB-dependent receptor n=1 Tax=Venatoribacter cucullus TaxID=2661630 RepID=A0A9X7UYH5_9GAMM|nr:TonB-dependent receptor [Venatoribacter cucullus]QQD25293.1 TonB-dependent receptor [Venatoribacter cucullus]